MQLEFDHLHRRARDAGFTTDQVKAGTPACVGIGSDTYPATVIEVKRSTSGVISKVTVQYDETHHGNGKTMYTPDPNGKTLTFSRRQNGRLAEVGRPTHQSRVVYFGVRDYDMDPCF